MIFNETIVAQITPVGKSGVGVIRVSGLLCNKIAMKILGKLPQERYATFSTFLDIEGNPLDKGIAIFFSAPRSFTGEDILELQGHGSQIVLNLILKNILSISSDIRIARAGEFSERAFLNGKLDLIQAESISDLIHANSERSARLSMESLQGRFSNYINNFLKKVIELRSEIEQNINFSELETEVNLNINITKKLNFLIKKILNTIELSRLGRVIRKGIKIVILGQPNVGKSSLFNFMCNKESAIVTNIAGTTRDVLHADLYVEDLLIHLVDTAGLREPENEIEKIGIDLAWKEIDTADQILFVFDGSNNEVSQLDLYFRIHALFPKNCQINIIINKYDLFLQKNNLFSCFDNEPVFYISVINGFGIDKLRSYLKKSIISTVDTTEDVFLARERHLNILNIIKKTLIRSNKNWIRSNNIELLADELSLVQKYLDEITGVFTTEKLLKNIFSKFCIGK